jgi:hypothetical protein
MLIFLCARSVKKEAESRNTHRTLVVAASDAGPASDIVSAKERASRANTGVSDGLASDAG